jgi:hypothetical protein
MTAGPKGSAFAQMASGRLLRSRRAMAQDGGEANDRRQDEPGVHQVMRALSVTRSKFEWFSAG